MGINFKTCPIVLFDACVTGQYPSCHEVIELSALKLDQESLNDYDRFYSRIHPQNLDDANPSFLRSSRYDEDAWKSASHISDAMSAFAVFSRGCIVSCYQMEFLWHFLSEAMKRHSIPNNVLDYRIDISSIAFLVLPDTPDYQLGTVAEHLGISIEPIAGESRPTRVIKLAKEVLKVFKASGEVLRHHST